MTDDSPAPPSGLRAVLPDLAPWHASRDFRRLWVSGLISNFGSFLTFYSVGPQLGQVRSDSFAAWWGVRASVWSGGVRWGCWRCACRG